MFPQITLFGKVLGTYALVAVAGALAAGVVFCALIRRRGQNDNDAIVVLLFAAVGVLLGGHLLFGLTNLRYFGLLFERVSPAEWFARVGALFGGSVFYGGLIGGAVAALLTIRVKRLNLPLYADCLAPVIPLFHGIARVGCFLGGCCYGIESPFGFVAHGNLYNPAVNDVRRFPVQLLEAACNLLLAGALLLLWRRQDRHPALRGRLIFVYLISYACIRFADEFLRGDEIRGFLGALSTSQVISLAVLAFSLVFLAVLRNRACGAE